MDPNARAETGTRQPTVDGLDRRGTVRVEVPGVGFRLPAPPSCAPVERSAGDAVEFAPVPAAAEISADRVSGLAVAVRPMALADGFGERSPIARAFYEAERATALAHRAFLRVAHDASTILSRRMESQLRLIERPRVDRPGESIVAIGDDPRSYACSTARSASSSRWDRLPPCWALSSRPSTAFRRGSGCRTSR